MKAALVIFAVLLIPPQKSEAGKLRDFLQRFRPQAAQRSVMHLPQFRTECSNGVCRRVPVK